MNVGFIGLGAMGAPMAKRVVEAGFPTFVTYHKRREPSDALAAAGAKVLGTAAEVARAADAVITIVPADAELRATVSGPGGLMEGFSKGKVLIDMTTCTAMTLLDLEKDLAAIGVEVLDAPVSGGTVGAINGTLTIMVGGEAALLEKCRPVLAAMGTKIVHVGPVGQGKVVKMVNQLMAAINLLAMGEAFALGVRCGADPAVLVNVIKDSSGGSKMLDSRAGFLLDGSFAPGFRLDLMKKDLNLGIDSARAERVPLLLGAMASQIFSAASGVGRGDEDFSAAAAHLAGLADVCLHQPRKGQAARK